MLILIGAVFVVGEGAEGDIALWKVIKDVSCGAFGMIDVVVSDIVVGIEVLKLDVPEISTKTLKVLSDPDLLMSVAVVKCISACPHAFDVLAVVVVVVVLLDEGLRRNVENI